ncbi:ATP-binding protein [Bacteroides sp. 519]|uniref:ATP-binding protein n=1 Tax=Bacteroides sp. 519 TaxID=2302937 RepID=UPI0013D3C690|nr:ATP-binding protein [Bacteroides sp. 519]NDV59463.1 ATP-binding protein [Bacteroides sp. 519]
MKFYNRESEIEKLQSIQKRSLENAQMTVVTGRRRIGKTQLLLKATENQPTLYFFVARKAENFLCQDFVQEVKDKLGIPILGEVTKFSELFKFLMELSKSQSFNLIIDEFQEFYTIAPSVYSDIQHHWDVNKDLSKMNLLLSGSVHSLMHKIFQNSKEPLFGRATALLKVKPFNTPVLKEILADHHPEYTSEDLLALYAFTGGVAKYVQLLIDSGSYTLEAMLDYIIREDSTFIPEGKNMLIEEFGKEYANYFTILSAIARGENTRAKIEAVVNREIGGYLTKLEHDYGLISKVIPIYAKVETKNARYTLDDNFLSFWFRFVYKYSYMVEVGGYGQLREIVVRDYPTFSGKILERYFRTQYMEQQRYTRIGGYWDRKGETEIDMIAVNELDKTARICEIKRNAGNISMDKLKEKGSQFVKATGELKDYEIEYQALSMKDM